MTEVRAHHSTLVLYGGNVAAVSDLTGQIHAEELHGLFAGDTRVLSTYKIEVNGCYWHVLGRSRLGHGTAQWEHQNCMLRDDQGEIGEGLIHFSLRRRLDGAMHDDLFIQSFASRPLRLRLTLQIDSDFADIFEVKSQSTPPRMNALRIPSAGGVSLIYERPGFRRALHVRLQASGSSPAFSGSRITFEVNVKPGAQWSCCLDAIPEIDGRMIQFRGDPHEPEPDAVSGYGRLEIHTEATLERPFMRGRSDLHALAVDPSRELPYIAAGAPWFMGLFGRDSLVTALMAGIDGSGSAEGTLAALGRRQGMRRDDFRDEEPGKILHELRCDELTTFGDLPYTPYYGSHDAPALYCLTLWHAWRWTGKRALLDAHLETARNAMRWCDELGDRDQDGLQEYATRSPKGYRNQGWKDAGDAVVHADGREPKLPLATVELQGYLFAARLAMSELLDAQGLGDEAEHMRAAAFRIRSLVEERFWLTEQSFYAFALDGDKEAVASLASNPGHLLWCGLPDLHRARIVARRLLAPDFFTGWGLRTLSAAHPAYNPLSYQLGSVWPHDTAIAAAGMWRYGLREEASVLAHGLLKAAARFEGERLPELFAGFDAACGFPVPYEKANTPQAWAAAVPLLLVQLFLGLMPDAPRGRCFFSPWLPQWLPRLEIKGIAIGGGTVDVAIARRGDETAIEAVDSDGIEVIHGTAEAPLWGAPPA